jgi:hypothetical protein
MKVHSYLWISGAGTWLLFTAWTVYVLGTRASRMGETTSRYGVRGFGLTAWFLTTCMGVYLAWQINPTRPLWYYGTVLGSALLPICMWGGYAWGVAMSALFPGASGKR